MSILQSKFTDFAKSVIHEAGKFDVLSNHGRIGMIINKAKRGNLKPTENQTTADRRPADLMYSEV
jgi:hypothetical protein